jgi:predicted glycosyltransferase
VKPIALLYCQHSLGLGHFVRSLTLAEALADNFDLIFINGGPVPRDIVLPTNIRFEHLPPLRMKEDGTLTGDGDVDAILRARRDQMLALAHSHHPALLIVELYPFGRKKFAAELDPLIQAVRHKGCKVACSVRDILVNERVDQARHDDRAALRLNSAFDAVLVHADDKIAHLYDSFKPATPLNIPVYHTGFVAKTAKAFTYDAEGPTLVTAGGGIVGQILYRAAINAQAALWKERRWSMTLIAGPFYPKDDWHGLCAAARDVPGLAIKRAMPSMTSLLHEAGRIVSQCGYNSALEIVQNHRPVLFVPFARGHESEQTMRAQQLSALGLADYVGEAGLDGPVLAHHILALQPPAANVTLNFDGAKCSAHLLKELIA